IVAVMGLKDTTTGDTLSAQKDPVILESMTFPAPVINVAIEPRTKSDQEKLGTAIQRLAEEDPTFQVRTDEETGQTIISGMGELHREVLAGYPMVDVKVTLIDGAYHEVDSSELAFKIAGSMAFKKAAAQADPALLEPVMAVEVRTPDEYMGEVIGDLNSRRGHIQAMEE